MSVNKICERGGSLRGGGGGGELGKELRGWDGEEVDILVLHLL